MALVSPHGGGGLKPLVLSGAALAAEIARAKTLPQLRISSREKGDLVMLGIGGFTPLEGFMTRADWQGVCERSRTAVLTEGRLGRERFGVRGTPTLMLTDGTRLHHPIAFPLMRQRRHPRPSPRLHSRRSGRPAPPAGDPCPAPR